jgi:phosphomevalonate kinase
MAKLPHHFGLNIIGIAGKQFAGKDEITRYLLNQLAGFQQSPIAGAIKHVYAQQHGLTLTELEANKAHHRPGLIELGNWGRQQDINYWLHQALERYPQVNSGIKGLIISDVRLPHEAETIRQQGGVLIRVEANRTIRQQRGTLMSENDPTETALDDYPHWHTTITNNHGLDELHQQLDNLLPQLRHYFDLQ